MALTDSDDAEVNPNWCTCEQPTPGKDGTDGRCRDCGELIAQPVIDGEVHAGYTSLGNGPAFFDAKERWHLNSGDRGTINTIDSGAWFRAFADAQVVCPHDHWKAQRMGTEALSLDHIVHPDGTVELVVQNRRLADLPSGPKFPVETGDVEQ